MNSQEFRAAAIAVTGSPGAVDAWLFDATRGPWADLSARFVANASGSVVTLTPIASMDRTFVQVEIPGLLENEKITTINGIPRENLVAIRNNALAVDGPDYALEKVKNALGYSSMQAASDMRIALDENGVVRGVDTGRLFEGTN